MTSGQGDLRRRKVDSILHHFVTREGLDEMEYTLDDIARTVCEAFGAVSCIIWELDQDEIADDLLPDAYLYPIARFDAADSLSSLRNVTGQSATFAAITSAEPIHNQPLTRDFMGSITEPVLDVDNFGFSAIPFSLNGAAKTSINIYTDLSRHLNASELTDLTLIAAILPLLYHGVRRNRELDFVQRVAALLTTTPPVEIHTYAERQKIFQPVVREIASGFRCEEVSLFIDFTGNMEVFSLSATTWPGHQGVTQYRITDSGLTAYVLSNRRPIRIVDLRLFQKNLAHIQLRYPQIDWRDSLGLKRDGTFQDRPLSFIAVPIMAAGSVKGVLRCCALASNPRYFTRDDLDLLSMFASIMSQLCVGCELVSETTKLVKANARIQLQVREDISHQVKGPIEQAHGWAKDLLAEGLNAPNATWKLTAIRGLLSKAKRVNRGTILFASLAKDLPIPLRKVRLYPGPLRRLLIETAADTEISIHPQMSISIYIDRDSADILKEKIVNVDLDYLEQVLGAVFDNAGKYSYASTEIGSTVKVVGDHLEIVVQNIGIPISPEEAKHATLRGWRSISAQAHTGEGSGIGLWIASQVLRAHGGFLEVMPTNSRRMTEVKIALPLQRTT